MLIVGKNWKKFHLIHTGRCGSTIVDVRKTMNLIDTSTIGFLSVIYFMIKKTN